MSLSATIVIPAIVDPDKLPGQPLLDRTGRPLVQHTIAAARRSAAARYVVIATDSMAVANAVSGLATVWVDDEYCWCGTQRVARAVRALPNRYRDVDVVVNWQCGEPMFPPVCADQLIGIKRDAPGVDVVTAVTGLSNADRECDDVVKAIIPDVDDPTRESVPTPVDWFLRTIPRRLWNRARRHVGIYAFSPMSLAEMESLEQTPASAAVHLEQISWVDVSCGVGAVEFAHIPNAADTPRGYDRFCLAESVDVDEML